MYIYTFNKVSFSIYLLSMFLIISMWLLLPIYRWKNWDYYVKQQKSTWIHAFYQSSRIDVLLKNLFPSQEFWVSKGYHQSTIKRASYNTRIPQNPSRFNSMKISCIINLIKIPQAITQLFPTFKAKDLNSNGRIMKKL